MEAIAGVPSTGSLAISIAQYLNLVDWTSRQMHPGKRGESDPERPRIRADLLQPSPDAPLSRNWRPGGSFWRRRERSGGDSPDHVAHIISDQQRAAAIDRHPGRSATRLAIVIQEAAQHEFG